MLYNFSLNENKDFFNKFCFILTVFSTQQNFFNKFRKKKYILSKTNSSLTLSVMPGIRVKTEIDKHIELIELIEP